MPFVAHSLFSLLFHTYLAVLLSTRYVLSQSTGTSVIVNVNDTTRWSTRGNWTLLPTLGDFSGNWLNATFSGDTSALISFAGTGLVVFGTVVNGTANQPMNVSVKLNSDDAVIPTYTRGSPNDIPFDYNNQIYKNASLPYQVHTLTVTVTGSTPFLLQGILYNSANNSSPSSTASPPVGTDPGASSLSGSSNDTPKLAGAIGGGIGALLLVGFIILYLMKRLRRIEKTERKLQAIPFLASSGNSRSNTGAYAPTATVRSGPQTNAQSSTAVDEKIRLKEQSAAVASSSRSFPRNHKSPLPSPAASLISVPSEFQHATTVVPAGTAVASSYIGTSPLPPVGLPGDTPPVPPMPADVKRKTKSMRRKEKQERQEINASVDRSTPNMGGLGLFSTDSVNTVGTTGSAGLSRPLPIVPGTRSSAPSYQFPPEKVGLSPPPPARREQSGGASKREKRPLPEPKALLPSR